MWARRLIIISVLGTLLMACANKEAAIVEHSYALKDATITTQVENLRFNLTDIFEVKVEVEHPDNYQLNLSMDKSYKKLLTMESFHKTEQVGALPDRIITLYRFSFAALQVGQAQVPSFNISVTTHLEKVNLETKAIPVNIEGVLPISEIKSMELKPAISKLSFPFNWFYLTVPAILLVVFGFYRSLKKEDKKSEETNLSINTYKLQLAQLPEKVLDPITFDIEVRNLLHQLSSLLDRTHFDDLKERWNKYHNEQSYSMDQEETIRQEKLVHFIIDDHTITKQTKPVSR